MVLHNPNNWHWVNKDVREWARQYLEKNLIGTSAEHEDVSANVSKILSMDGDVDVSQRKGKVITLFDVKLQMEYEGTGAFHEQLDHIFDNVAGAAKDEEDVSGTITIPEVAHDTEADEYVVCSLLSLELLHYSMLTQGVLSVRHRHLLRFFFQTARQGFGSLENCTSTSPKVISTRSRAHH